MHVHEKWPFWPNLTDRSIFFDDVVVTIPLHHQNLRLIISQQRMIQAGNYAELSLPELIRDYARHIEAVEGL